MFILKNNCVVIIYNFVMESVPEIIFIVPYRDRELQMEFFRNHMTDVVLKDYSKESYRIMFIHQNDTRTFNRGAIKNIGFLAVKDLYPNVYHDITFVFNDVDTVPFRKNSFKYKTTPGVIKHFYGFTFALGGIVSINARDFETLNGFPNFWSWGYEDNDLQRRATIRNLEIDRSEFYRILDKRIIHIQDGYLRNVNSSEKQKYDWKTTEGINDISKLEYTINEDIVNVTNFQTKQPEDIASNGVYDLRKSLRPKRRSAISMKIGI